MFPVVLPGDDISPKWGKRVDGDDFHVLLFYFSDNNS